MLRISMTEGRLQRKPLHERETEGTIYCANEGRIEGERDNVLDGDSLG
jgi:hypothetical protein